MCLKICFGQLQGLKYFSLCQYPLGQQKNHVAGNMPFAHDVLGWPEIWSR